jgi:hypothetical protein
MLCTSGLDSSMMGSTMFSSSSSPSILRHQLIKKSPLYPPYDMLVQLPVPRRSRYRASSTRQIGWSSDLVWLHTQFDGKNKGGPNSHLDHLHRSTHCMFFNAQSAASVQNCPSKFFQSRKLHSSRNSGVENVKWR